MGFSFLLPQTKVHLSKQSERRLGRRSLPCYPDSHATHTAANSSSLCNSKFAASSQAWHALKNAMLALKLPSPAEKLGILGFSSASITSLQKGHFSSTGLGEKAPLIGGLSSGPRTTDGQTLPTPQTHTRAPKDSRTALKELAVPHAHCEERCPSDRAEHKHPYPGVGNRSSPHRTETPLPRPCSMPSCC